MFQEGQLPQCGERLVDREQYQSYIRHPSSPIRPRYKAPNDAGWGRFIERLF
jgi:hypothetical protein